jgi:glycosyltransferase involved in cell wall biosynthesis
MAAARSSRRRLLGTEVLPIRAESAYPLITPGPRVRVAAFAPFLQDHAVALRFSSHLSASEYRELSAPGHGLEKALALAACAARVARRSRDRDELLMVHRLLSLIPVPAGDPPARVDVYDFDDALFEDSFSTSRQSLRRIKRDRARCHAYLRRARLVLAGNAYLASHAREYADHVEILPSCVDPTAQPLREHGDTDVITVGWVGSASTTPYLEALLPVFHSINRDRIRMRLVAVGAGPLHDAPWLEQRSWSLASESGSLASFDVGVMPLPDDPWTRGKCGYKLLQYYAAGVPAVASPVGVNRDLLARGGGLAATTERQWRAGLEELASDSNARRQAGLLGRQLVAAEYSYQRWSPELAAMLQTL